MDQQVEFLTHWTSPGALPPLADLSRRVSPTTASVPCGTASVLAGLISACSCESKAHGTGSVNPDGYGGPRPGVTSVPREDS